MEPSNGQNLSPFGPKNFTHDSSSLPPSSNQLAPQENKYLEHWTREENKVFENALAEFGLDSPILLPTLALRIPTKSVSQLREHFEALVNDIRMIESDAYEIPNLEEKNNTSSSQVKIEGPKGGRRKRGAPWTTGEHELFLLGLEKYGKGDWKSISREVVQTKTPTQVASHAQKYFLKLQNPNSRRCKDGSVMRTVEDPLPAAGAVCSLSTPMTGLSR